MKGPITISAAIAWKQTLTTRHGELVSLRNENSHRQTVHYGANADKHQVIEPLYDVVALDNTITKVAREIRILDEAIKSTNQSVNVQNYERDDDVLGELVPAKSKVS